MAKAKRAVKVVVELEVIQDQVINLRLCKEKDILISKHGKKFEYLEPTPNHYFDHNIRSLDGEFKGQIHSRTHEGYVFRKNRKPEDHDIVQVLRAKSQ
jgi:hypothetical protein